MLGYAYVERGVKYDPMERIAAIDRFPFKQHYNHPMSKWVRTSESNFIWTLNHLVALLDEYESRYKKRHKYAFVPAWIEQNRITFMSFEKTDWPRCFGDYKNIIAITPSAIEDYREYYRLGKRSFARWNYSQRPDWF